MFQISYFNYFTLVIIIIHYILFKKNRNKIWKLFLKLNYYLECKYILSYNDLGNEQSQGLLYPCLYLAQVRSQPSVSFPSTLILTISSSYTTCSHIFLYLLFFGLFHPRFFSTLISLIFLTDKVLTYYLDVQYLMTSVFSTDTDSWLEQSQS